MSTSDGAAARLSATSEAPPVRHGEIDSLMRRFFEQNQGAAAQAVVSAEPPRPRRDFDMACELLERASEAFELLMGRCQRLEGDLEEAGERARVQAAEQADMVEQWKRLASGLKAQLETSNQATAALKSRCDAAEARAAAAEQRVTALERASAQAADHAALAESRSTKLHDKVVSAFGIGSRAHPVLAAVATRGAGV